ncbi:MAG: TlpA disulfide reductase family protein [Solirubrobacteraceae bacterium]
MSDEASGRDEPRWHFGRWIGVAAAAAFIALLAYGLVKQAPNTTIDDALAQQQPVAAPGFELEVLDEGDLAVTTALGRRVSAATTDGRLSLAELRGTPVVLNFWASWCVPCRIEAPVLEQGWRAARGQGVLFLGLNLQDVREDAREFIERFKSTFPHVREPDKRTLQSYGGTGLPETYFIRADGRVVGHVIGAISSAQLAQGVAAAKSGRPIATGIGGARQEAP